MRDACVRTIKNPRTWVGGVAVAVLGGALAAGNLPIQAANEAAKTPTVEKQHAQMLSESFRNAAADVLPSVVAIRHEMPVVRANPRSRMPAAEQQNPFGEDSPFGGMLNDPQLRRFFRNMPDMPSQPEGHGGGSGSGSGVIIDAEGLILTNNHVVTGGGKVTVRLHDGREFVAKEVKTDPSTDIAIVRIEGVKGLKAARLAKSSEMQIGDWVLALGQPFGLQNTVTAGIISAKDRGLSITDRGTFLQTDAAINPGNSGGPLVNLDGEVVGINTAISTQSGGYQGVGFAIPIDTAQWVAYQLADKGSVQRAYLGVAIQPVTQDLANQFGVNATEGVVVTQVFPNSPAEEAGVKMGDVIVAFGNHKVHGPRELQNLVERMPEGSREKLAIVRDGKPQTLTMTGRPQPSDFGVARAKANVKESAPEGHTFDGLGLEVADLDRDVARQLGLKSTEGVVITHVEDGSPADALGLTTSMAIVQVNRKPVKNVEEFQAAMDAKSMHEGVLLLVRTPEGSRYVVIRSEK